MIIVGRHINGITINPLEYLLDDNGDEMLFENEEKAMDFLKENGYADDEMEWFTFQDIDELTSEHTEETESETLSARSPLPFSPKRMERLLDKALDWIGENATDYELYDTLKNIIGMTNKEIKAAGFELAELDDDEEPEITMQ